MDEVKFGNNKSKVDIHVSSITAFPIAIQFYTEKERFVDAEVFMFSIKLFMIELLIGIKIKVK